jgi:hypothetical protein
MKQISLATNGFELVTKRTRKREFLNEMNLVFPWSQLLALIAPHEPAGVILPFCKGCRSRNVKQPWPADARV